MYMMEQQFQTNCYNIPNDRDFKQSLKRSQDSKIIQQCLKHVQKAFILWKMNQDRKDHMFSQKKTKRKAHGRGYCYDGTLHCTVGYITILGGQKSPKKIFSLKNPLLELKTTYEERRHTYIHKINVYNDEHVPSTVYSVLKPALSKNY